MNIDFRTAVLAMAQDMPNARVSTIVRLALAVENALPPDLNDAKELARWSMRQPEIVRLLGADQRIQAINELRATTGASLLQAKNAIDVAATP